MDAFERLAKLAGASVGAVGEGLPRTRKEALSLGVARYFTERPCVHGHVAERLASGGHCYECHRQRVRERYATPEGKEYQRQYHGTARHRECQRQYHATPERKERERVRGRSATKRDRQLQIRLAKTGDAALYAINQSERAACRGRAFCDIIPQCPEPQRSQLQALVDRIKADPQAGKAVVGLLRTMRELRKAELAELRASD